MEDTVMSGHPGATSDRFNSGDGEYTVNDKRTMVVGYSEQDEIHQKQYYTSLIPRRWATSCLAPTWVISSVRKTAAPWMAT
jgi:hypothetical protein